MGTTRSRKRRESDCDLTANPNQTKKRKISNLSGKKVEDFIEETMTTKECRKVFDEFLRTKQVECSSEGNWCRIGECDKFFGKKCHLKRHVDEAHIGRRFRCSFPACSYDQNGRTFKQKGPAKEHINNVH